MEELNAILAQMDADNRTEAEKRLVINEWKLRNPDKLDVGGKLGATRDRSKDKS